MTLRAVLSHVDGTTTFSVDSLDPVEVKEWVKKMDHEGADFYLTVVADGEQAHKLLTAIEPMRP